VIAAASKGGAIVKGDGSSRSIATLARNEALARQGLLDKPGRPKNWALGPGMAVPSKYQKNTFV
jgi:hypothetical protein